MDPLGPVPLDELTLTVVVDNLTDTLSTVDPEVPQTPEVFRLLGRVAPHDLIDGYHGFEPWEHHCVACHGLSVVAEGRVGDERHAVLFDAGPYGDVWIDNAHRLGVDLSAVETVFLSHWHWDHSGALPAAVDAIAEARRVAGHPDPVVVDLHPDRPDQRGIKLGEDTLVLLSPEPTLDDLAEAGGRVELHAESHLVAGGFFLGSGEIERRTSYETGLAGHHSIRAGVATPDPLILDERFLAAEVRGRGITVLSACSHAGIVNACLAAMDQLPDRPVDVVLGGYHLAGPGMEERIDDTVRDLVELVDPAVVAPGHCTGWRARTALAGRFAPHNYGPSSVGSTYRLTAR
jgi:7,8-dihydropterin-6-yl-methyl-4-(beta-D-ribofuranosyl)aminobenzene 5'-phosphate synthase